MNNYTNPYRRLQQYFNLLINDNETLCTDEAYEYGIPLSRIQELTKIPIMVIRNDFLALFRWQNSLAKTCASIKESDHFCGNNILDFAEDSPAYIELNKVFDLENLYEQVMSDTFPPVLEQLLLNGTLDKLPLHLTLNNGEAAQFSIPITPDEAEALHAFRQKESHFSDTFNRFSRLYQGVFQIKDSYLYNHQYHIELTLNELLDTINQAIANKNCLQMNYKTAKGKIKSFYFQPIKIAYDSTENLYFVLSIYKNKIHVYRLDHILSLMHLEKTPQKIAPLDTSLLDIAPNVWGCCFSEHPEHVKIRFYNEANVWEKVRKDLAYRTNGKLYEQDNFLYYEDIVYGISKLRPWIYSFGSSAIVLEPESLRQHIIDSLHDRLNQKNC